jgi:hypothetical protein
MDDKELRHRKALNNLQMGNRLFAEGKSLDEVNKALRETPHEEKVRQNRLYLMDKHKD